MLILASTLVQSQAVAESTFEIGFVMVNPLTGKSVGSGAQIQLDAVNRDKHFNKQTDADGVATFTLTSEQYVLQSHCGVCVKGNQNQATNLDRSGTQYLIKPNSDGSVQVLSAADETVVKDSKGNWIISTKTKRDSVAHDPWQLIAKQPNLQNGQRVELMFLLTNGKVMASTSNHQGANQWWILSPDASGSYVNGTWAQAASPVNYNPVTFNGAILHSGNLLVVGGEMNYTDSGVSSENTNMSELYNVTTNTWTEISPPAGGQGDWAEIGSPPFIELADGRVMIGFFGKNGQSTHNESMIFDEKTMSWTLAGTNKVGRNTEAGFTLLQSDKVLSVNTSGNRSFMTSAEIYDPATDSWSSAGNTPASLENSEIGPAITLPNGKVLATGVTGNHALYDPMSNSWSAVPAWPKLKNGLQLAADDNDAVILPNGNVLTVTAVFPFDTGNAISMAPARYVEYDWVSNTWLWKPDDLVSVSSSEMPNLTFMLPLPTGQILVANNGQLEFYDNSQPPKSTWRPVIEKVSAETLSPGPTYSVSGKQLSGLTQAQQWGDEWEAATNYPIVQIESKSSHRISYGRSFDFSTTSIGPDTPSTFSFVIAKDAEDGPSLIRVIANGIASAPIDVTIAGGSKRVSTETPAVTPKKTSITCVKGKLTKKIIGLKPVCPNGFKKK